MTGTRRKLATMVAAAGLLGSMLVWNGPAQAVPNRGINGLIAAAPCPPTSRA